jgi:hypothetical protein
MENPTSARELVGCAVHAIDGNIGKVRELFFDDSTWAVRYLVVDVRKWLFHRKVLVSSPALGKPDTERRFIPVSITRDQVRRSPWVNTDMPIALQHQASLHAHYGWEVYWGAEALMGSPVPDLFSPQAQVNHGGKPFDPHLRSTKIVTGHEIRALDGSAGRVEDFLIDGETWTIQRLIARTDENRFVLLPLTAVTRISFEEQRVFVNASTAEVRSFPGHVFSLAGGHMQASEGGMSRIA